MKIKRVISFLLACMLLVCVPAVEAASVPDTQQVEVIARRLTDVSANVYKLRISRWKKEEVQVGDFRFQASGGALFSSGKLVIHQILPSTPGYDWFEHCAGAFGFRVAPFELYGEKDGKRTEVPDRVKLTVTLPETYSSPALYYLDVNGNLSKVEFKADNRSVTFPVSRSGYYVFVDQTETETPEQYYTVTALASKGGTITPAGALQVKEGASLDFTVSADEGYRIKDVTVDEESIGAVSSYTLSEIRTSHTIHAEFERTEVNIGTLLEDLLDKIFGKWGN